MAEIADVRKIMLSLPLVTEEQHFHLTTFRVRKKIFCTIHEKENRVMVKLTPADQSVFCAFDKLIIYPVPGAWGRGGATYLELVKVRKSMLRDAIVTAYNTLSVK